MPKAPQQMSADDYARLERDQRQIVVRANNLWWRRVRPFFFRPLLPFKECSPVSIAVPRMARLGGFQYAVSDSSSANSAMHFLIFEEANLYCLDRLDKECRRQIRVASREFTVRALTDPEEFKISAYPVYLSFFNRTRYHFRSDRVFKHRFDDWADAIFRKPGPIVQGAFSGSDLCAVSIASIVDDTLLYGTFFGTAECLRNHVTSLMLHAARGMAAEAGYVKQVYLGMRKTGIAQSVDDFYLLRGCRMVTKPARLWLNPVSQLLLRWLMPEKFELLLGKNQIARHSMDPGNDKS